MAVVIVADCSFGRCPGKFVVRLAEVEDKMARDGKKTVKVRVRACACACARSECT